MDKNSLAVRIFVQVTLCPFGSTGGQFLYYTGGSCTVDHLKEYTERLNADLIISISWTCNDKHLKRVEVRKSCAVFFIINVYKVSWRKSLLDKE